jgi:hypothetical protein
MRGRKPKPTVLKVFLTPIRANVPSTTRSQFPALAIRNARTGSTQKPRRNGRELPRNSARWAFYPALIARH